MRTAVKATHPRGLYVLFFTALWERFSYYGMRALLIFYMTKVFLFSDDKSYVTYGAYTALVYTLPIIGGIVADRILGYRRAIIYGSILIIVGHFLTALPGLHTFYWGMAFIIGGTGFFRPNLITMVGSLYDRDDPRRDSGYTIYYMGVNLGSLVAPLICGVIGERYGWNYGFGLAGVGMMFGLAVFILGRNTLNNIGYPTNPAKLKARSPLLLSWELVIYALGMAAVAVVAWVLEHPAVAGNLLSIVGVTMFVIIATIAIRSEPIVRNRLFGLMLMMVFSLIFWAFNEQAGSSLNLFADRNVDRHFFSWLIPASVFQSLNPLYIIVFGPVLALLWNKLAAKGREPSTPIKFSLALFQIAIGFVFFAVGAYLAQKTGQSSMIWLCLGYWIYTLAELCLEPVAYSLVTRLSPANITSMMLGCYSLFTAAFANYIAATFIARFASAPDDAGVTKIQPAAMATLYYKLFYEIAIVSAVVGVVLLVLTPWLKRLLMDPAQQDN